MVLLGADEAVRPDPVGGVHRHVAPQHRNTDRRHVRHRAVRAETDHGDHGGLAARRLVLAPR